MKKIISILAILCFFGCKSIEQKKNKKMNVLFISIDDMKTELGISGFFWRKFSHGFETIRNFGFLISQKKPLHVD